MASYNFYDNATLPLWDRFSSIMDVARQDEPNEPLPRSLELWQDTFILNEPVPSESVLRDLLTNLKALPTMSPRQSCPTYRLFVSHRQIDKNYALAIAEIANKKGFEFWLDVLNPPLVNVTTSTRLSVAQKALLTACIIEIGLLNSTHILAVMTKHAKGSQWIPYEYGRVRSMSNTACWRHPTQVFTLPEYMLLGKQTRNQPEIENWLLSFYKPSPPCSPIPWAWKRTKLLP